LSVFHWRYPPLDAMKVEVALYATLSKYLPPGAQNRKAVIEVKDGATVREVMNQLGIPADLPNILLVNGRQAPDGTILKDGETVSIFPPLAGGSTSARPSLAGNRSASRPLICAS
jgi:molybdopterin converting factor small subunit